MRLQVASIALAAFAAAGVAVAETRGAAMPQTSSRSCSRLEVTSGPAARALSQSVLPRSLPRFAATRVLDLTFAVLLPPGFEGRHLVELRVFTPDAQLYRSMAVPVGGNTALNATRQVDGYARPLPEQALTRVTRGRRPFLAASTAFPVAGTDIVSSGLYGRWRVEAHLDGAEQQCGPAASFVLVP